MNFVSIQQYAKIAPMSFKFQLIYMFYDHDNDVIAKNIKKTFIDTPLDLIMFKIVSILKVHGFRYLTSINRVRGRFIGTQLQFIIPYNLSPSKLFRGIINVFSRYKKKNITFSNTIFLAKALQHKTR